jgi:hypothetical protein
MLLLGLKSKLKYPLLTDQVGAYISIQSSGFVKLGKVEDVKDVWKIPQLSSALHISHITHHILAASAWDCFFEAVLLTTKKYSLQSLVVQK